MNFAIVYATVPGSTGAVSYTDSRITNWSGGGLAIVVISGDSANEAAGAWLSEGLVDSAGHQSCSSFHAHASATTTSQDRETNGDDHCGALLDDTTGSSLNLWASVKFSSALSNGVSLNWDDVSGVSGRTFKVMVILIDGLSSVNVLNNPATAAGFSAHALLHLANGRGSFGHLPEAGNFGNFSPGLGAALNLGGLPQKSAMSNWPRGANPTTARGSRETASWSVSADQTTRVTGQVTAITGTGITTTGTSRGLFASMRSPSGAADFALAIEALDGTTGTKHFTGLGKRCGLVFGFICGSTSDNTFETDAARFENCCFFAYDGTTLISIAASQKQGVSGSPKQARSRAASGSIDMINGAGGSAFLAASPALTTSGLDLVVSTGFSGTMFLFGFRDPVIQPDPVVLALSAPAVARLLAEAPSPALLALAAPAVARVLTEVPTPAHLALAAPAVARLLTELPTPAHLALAAPAVLRFFSAEVPAPVVLALVVPDVAVQGPVPTPMVARVLGPLGDLYLEALLDLLPRGPAWTRRRDSVLARLMRAFAAELERVEFRAQDLRDEADLRATRELLPEWEELLGTLRDCPTFDDTELERRFAVFSKWTSPGGQSPFHFASVAQALGYDVQVEDLREFREFTAGHGHAGDPLSNGAWAFVVEVHAPEQTPRFFRADLSCADEPLVAFGNDALVCALDAIKPAHVLFLYVFDKPYVGYAPWSTLFPAPVRLALSLPFPRRFAT